MPVILGTNVAYNRGLAEAEALSCMSDAHSLTASPSFLVKALLDIYHTTTGWIRMILTLNSLCLPALCSRDG